jgi:hypothetical protein
MTGVRSGKGSRLEGWKADPACKYFGTPGGCRRGDKCIYAHGRDELPNLLKTRMCKKNVTGHCYEGECSLNIPFAFLRCGILMQTLLVRCLRDVLWEEPLH